MNNSFNPHVTLRPRIGVVITSWSHEDGAEYARRLVTHFPTTAPADQVEIAMSPLVLEDERDIPKIKAHFMPHEIEALMLVPGNFTLDHVMPLLAQEMNLPTILWGIPTQEAWGALVCAQQAIFPLKELNLRYLFVVGELGTEKTWKKVLLYARGAALIKRIKGMRIGLMGWRAQGMSDMAFDELALREVFGVQVVNVGLTRYTRAVEAIPEPEVVGAWQGERAGFELSQVQEDVALYGMRSYLALKQLQEEENLQAVTVECFHDHLGGPCIGCSKLNDEGVAASCESDVCGAVAMAAGQLLTGEPTFHTDALKVDLAKNSAIWHHCGNLPRRLAEKPDQLSLLAIPEHIGPGAYGPVIQATMKPGPVTAVNLVGRRGNMRVCALEGEAISHELEFPGSAAKVVYPFDLAEALERIGNAGYGHHFALVQGHICEEIGAWCELLGIEHMLIDYQTRY